MQQLPAEHSDVSQCDGGHVQTPYTSSPVTLGSTAPPPVTSTPDESSSHGTTSHDCENVQESSNLHSHLFVSVASIARFHSAYR